jgi:hypothetical protein
MIFKEAHRSLEESPSWPVAKTTSWRRFCKTSLGNVHCGSPACQLLTGDIFPTKRQWGRRAGFLPSFQSARHFDSMTTPLIDISSLGDWAEKITCDCDRITADGSGVAEVLEEINKGKNDRTQSN